MMNMIAGIVNSEYLMQIADGHGKVGEKDSFKKVSADRISAVTKVAPISSVKEDKTKAETKIYTTKVKQCEDGQSTVVMVAGYSFYRQINLSGKGQEADPALINPVKVRQAYFMDEAE